MLYQLDNIVRYNTFPKVKQESVATHSYYVGLFTMMICDELCVSSAVKLKALEAALVHDVPEIVTNDITYAAKKNMPGISSILERYEEEMLRETFPAQCDHIHGKVKSKDEMLALEIVKLADIISVLQFVDYEISMGNQNVIDWVGDTLERIKVQKQNIERLGILCQKIMI
jgi:5'-deoxynucleotidase YfbR-like HD superfamily hydrolase